TLLADRHNGRVRADPEADRFRQLGIASPPAFLAGSDVQPRLGDPFDGFEAEAAGNRHQRTDTGGAQPRGAAVDRIAAELYGSGAPADPVGRFEDDRMQTGCQQFARRGEASDPGPDDDDIDR